MIKKFALILLFLLIIACGQESPTNPGSDDLSTIEGLKDRIENLDLITEFELAEDINNHTGNWTEFGKRFPFKKSLIFKYTTDGTEEYYPESKILVTKTFDFDGREIWFECSFKNSLPENLLPNFELEIEGINYGVEWDSINGYFMIFKNCKLNNWRSNE